MRLWIAPFYKKLLIALFILLFDYVVNNDIVNSQTAFTEVSQQSGVAQITPTWGVSWGDVNNDGFEDIYIGNHHYSLKHADVQTHPALFLNNGDRTYIDVAASYGIVPIGDFHGAIWGDFNNDGFHDLFQSEGGNRSQGGAPNRLYKNLMNGTFTEIGEFAGVGGGPSRGRGGIWLDYNLDGLLDLYICNERLNGYPSTLMKNNGDDTFTDVGSALGVTVQGAIMGSPVDYNNDYKVDLFLASRERLWLFKNNGNGTFSDITSASGLNGIIYSQGFSWGDFDNDGDVDLYVASGALNDTIQWDSNGLYFMTDVFGGAEKGIDFLFSGSTVTFDIYDYQWRVKPASIYIGAQGLHPATVPFTLQAGDPEAQGKPIYTLGGETAYYIWEESGVWYIRSTTVNTRSGESFGGVIKSDGMVTSVTPFNFDFIEGNRPNKLYENQGNETFVDVAGSAGVADTSQSISAVWTDFDNDGWLDLYVVNIGEIFNAPNRLYMNQGNNTFIDNAVLSGVEANVAGRGENTTVGDYDNNGFMDIFVTNGYGQSPFSYGPHLLYHNNGNNNHWLKIKLVGKLSNRDAVGATITARVGTTQYLRQQSGGASRFSQNSQIVHFGIGSSTIIDELTVHWPSGVLQTIQNVNADQTIVLEEPTVTINMTPEKKLYLPGEKLRYRLTLINETNINISFDFWTNVTLLNGNIYPAGELIGPTLVTLLPLSTAKKVLSHNVLSSTKPGNYIYNGYAGPYPAFWKENNFTFTIQP